jgi:signal transduction histidine kinase
MVVFCLSEVRHSVLNLESPLVTEAGLGAALTHVGRQMSAGRTNEIRVAISGAVRPLPPAVEHHLFRIGQEALNNAIKHAKADHISVELIYAEDSVRLAVNDDGCGFVVAAVTGAGGEHLGVRSLRGRARKLGGRLTINSQSGRGTTVEVIVPIGASPQPVA